ncbi:holo-ACP synthase [Alkalilimnicola sp. S0819]|uniref:holo-ACP synthase n=1 Tax=Alkalilimnicola sp. S0819 TaxID=2613922 RepID=UPI0012618FED|nr:holo-ACP synthase [Alkalilimnicola sp. S0819]KAB7627563.1 holo-ACP synthase [Alkalilimnicola sp. S0819]MPQ15720.1 holo-ACP synthase [Alkalilimnicola sp. S0819]
MSIVGLGTDIVRVARLARIQARHGERFALRILTEAELAGYRRSPRPEAVLARRLAAKEAAAKALGTGIAAGVTFKDLEVSHDALGKPLLRLHGAAARRLQALGGRRCHLSISDEQDYAVAFVVLES